MSLELFWTAVIEGIADPVIFGFAEHALVADNIVESDKGSIVVEIDGNELDTVFDVVKFALALLKVGLAWLMVWFALVGTWVECKAGRP